MKETLLRLDTKGVINDAQCHLRVGQSAHHGALSSHNNTFWTKRNRKGDAKVVFSVGDNIYKHPNEKVVEYFENHLFQIHSTNRLGLLKEISDREETRDLFIHLSTFSSPVSNPNTQSNYSGDQCFNLDQDGNFV